MSSRNSVRAYSSYFSLSELFMVFSPATKSPPRPVIRTMEIMMSGIAITRIIMKPGDLLSSHDNASMRLKRISQSIPRLNVAAARPRALLQSIFGGGFVSPSRAYARYCNLFLAGLRLAKNTSRAANVRFPVRTLENVR